MPIGIARILGGPARSSPSGICRCRTVVERYFYGTEPDTESTRR